MRTTYTYILRLMGGMLMLLLMLTACSSGDDSQSDKTVLKIYVYAPDHPIVTRADNGNVSATDEENAVNTLHVWVFEHHEEGDADADKDGKFVGYISLDNLDLSTGQEVLMNITDPSFVTNQPNVDVYVMANVTSTNCGLSLNSGTTRAQLDAALIQHDGSDDYFGLSSPLTSVPDDGLPMSGVLKDKAIIGESPVFSIGEGSTPINVKLVRAVSKVRFIICSNYGDEGHTVKSISIDGVTFPTQEYLFLNGEYSADGGVGVRFKVGDSYEDGSLKLFEPQTPRVINPMVDNTKDPSQYDWANLTGDAHTGQGYETLIATGVTAGDLNDLGTYYLRESDKKITGTITFDGDRTASFSMMDDGDEDAYDDNFGRNHTWIVYAYFQYGVGLNVVTVKVNGWDVQSGSTEHEVYNW